MANVRTSPIPGADPNLHDPLSETTRARRLWAAHLRAGLSTADVARQLRVRWQTVDDWYAGAVPHLDQFVAACELAGYSPHEIIYGRGPSGPVGTRELTTDEIRMLLGRLQVPHETRRAFAAWQESPGGKYECYTAATVQQWIVTYTGALHNGADVATATERAAQAMVQAHALAAGVRHGAKPVDVTGLAGALERSHGNGVPPAPTPRKRTRTGEHDRSTSHRKPRHR